MSLRLGGVGQCYLHGFRYASKKAYCALIYFAYRTTDGETHVRLLASKTRVAPLKELSVPRLEFNVGKDSWATYAQGEEC